MYGDATGVCSETEPLCTKSISCRRRCLSIPPPLPEQRGAQHEQRDQCPQPEVVATENDPENNKTTMRRKGIPDYFFLRSHFVFFDFDEPLAFFFWTIWPSWRRLSGWDTIISPSCCGKRTAEFRPVCAENRKGTGFIFEMLLKTLIFQGILYICTEILMQKYCF